MKSVSKYSSILSHPVYALTKIFRYLKNKRKFACYHWTDRVVDTNNISSEFVFLGEGVYIGPRCRIQAITKYEGVNYTPHIIFGDNSSVQQDLYMTCASRIEIGSNTAIAGFVTITDIDHPYGDVDIPIERQNLKVCNVSIGSDCKIYNGAVITNGTSIGKHCVVGANSVVKGMFPDYCIIVGNPAKIVKRYNPLTGLWQRTNCDGSFK